MDQSPEDPDASSPLESDGNRVTLGMSSAPDSTAQSRVPVTEDISKRGASSPAKNQSPSLRKETTYDEVGRENQDSGFIDEENGRFVIVSDGMGGYAAGEIASQLAVEKSKDII